MSDKILDFEQPTEDVIENYEEFDYLTDFYLPFRDQEAKYNSDILKGVTRTSLMKIIKKTSLKLIEKRFSVEQLLNADEVFLTNSIKWIQWVSRYKKKSFKNDISADLFQKLQLLVLD